MKIDYRILYRASIEYADGDTSVVNMAVPVPTDMYDRQAGSEIARERVQLGHKAVKNIHLENVGTVEVITLG